MISHAHESFHILPAVAGQARELPGQSHFLWSITLAIWGIYLLILLLRLMVHLPLLWCFNLDWLRCSEFRITKTFDLISNGSNVAVTRENWLQYIQLVSHYRLGKQIKLQSEAFFEGFLEMIDTNWLQWVLTTILCWQSRLMVWPTVCSINRRSRYCLQVSTHLLISKKHTNYGGLYDNYKTMITAFWNVSILYSKPTVAVAADQRMCRLWSVVTRQDFISTTMNWTMNILAALSSTVMVYSWNVVML